MKVVLVKEKVCHPRFSIRQGMKSISFAIKFIVKQIIDIYRHAQALKKLCIYDIISVVIILFLNNLYNKKRFSCIIHLPKKNH